VISGAYLRVGLFMLGGIALLVAFVWYLGGARIGRGALYESYFSESVQGLEVGASVKFRGVTIGRVSEIGLANAEYGQGAGIAREKDSYSLVFVRYAIETAKVGPIPDTTTAIERGLRVRIASQGLTGISYLELDFVDPERFPALSVPWQPKAEYIPSMPSTFTQVQDAAQQFLTKLSRVDIDSLSIQLTGLISDLRTNVSNGDVHDTLAAATTLLRSTNDTIQAMDLPGLSTDLKRTSTAIRDTVQGEETQKLLSNAALAADRIANVAARLPPLIASLQAFSQRAGSGTADLEQTLVPLLRDTRAVVQNLRELTDSLRRYPAQILGGPPPRATETAR
jgi:ABC-type transporter Mla subunit MlaD